MAVITDFKLCLKAIGEGDFKSFNLSSFIKKFQVDPIKLGDHLQFALHKFCKQNEDKEVEEVVIKLSRLCFSKESAIGFNNMDRFLGSLFHICTYFHNKNEFAITLEISRSVEFKATEIEKSAIEQQSTRNFLYILHSHFLAAAQRIVVEDNYLSNDEKMVLSYEMAQMSINFLNFIKIMLPDLGRKLFRNFNNYISNVKNFDKKRLYELYRNMENSLKNLMPMYRDNDFLLYYFIKMDHAQDITGMEHKNLICHFRKHLEIFSVLINNSKTIKYWELVFSEDPKSEEYFNNLVLLVNQLSLQKNSKFHLLHFMIYFNYIAQLYIKNDSDDFSEVISAKIVKQLYKGILLPMKTILRNMSDYCRPVEYQMDICFSDYYIMNYFKILHLIRLCLKYNVTGCVDLLNISRECFSIIVKHLKAMSNKCCLNRKKQCWNNLVFHYTNTVEGILRHPTADNSWQHMRNCAEELLCEIINTEFEIPYEWKRIKLLFQRWHYACLKSNEYEMALFVSAFYIITYPQEEEDALSMWVQTKLEITNEVSKCATFKDVIDRGLDKIKTMNQKFDVSELHLKRLLMKELIAYSSSSVLTAKSCSGLVSPILKVWDVLKDMDLKPWERAAALNHVIAATISSADSECLKKYRKDCESVINDIMNSRKKQDCRSLLYTGNLKYSLFLCHLKSVQDIEEKICASKSILEYLKKEEEEKIKFGEAVDLNLTCNVMPSSNHFTITFEANHLEALNETFDLWWEVVEKIQPSSLESYEFDSWLHNVKQISQMYTLLGDFNQSFLSWLLYYRISKICDNRPCLLLGLSHIICEYSNVENSTFLKEAEEIADDLLASNKGKDIVITYWLAVAFNYLKNKDRGKCFDYLCKTKNVIDSMKATTRSYTFHARYWCLVSKFLCLNYDLMEKFGLKAGTELRTVVFKAFRYSNSAIKDGSLCNLSSAEYNEVLLTMLEVDVWACRFFGVYHQTSFMRFFLDDLYQIFQKLVLPTRTAYILMLLAEVDVMCEKTDDGTIKLNSLKSILGNLSLPKKEDEDIRQTQSGLLEVSANKEDEMESPRAPSPARFLNVHGCTRERDPSPFRYVLNDVDLVKRLNHTPKCTCYVCRNLLIKLIYVNVLLLEAKLHQMNGFIKKSCLYYKEGYENQKKLELYQLEQSKHLFGAISKSVTGLNGVFDFHCELVKVNSVKFLTNYALFMLSPSLKGNMIEDVYKLIGKIDKIMLGLSYENKLLQWQIMELKLMCFAVQECRVQEKKEEKPVSFHNRQASGPKPSATPLVSKNPRRNGAPIKYKQSKNVKSPNLFVSKPSGRKIFNDDEDKPVISKEDVVKKKKTPVTKTRNTRKAAESAVEPKKRNTRKKVQTVMDVELLS